MDRRDCLGGLDGLEKDQEGIFLVVMRPRFLRISLERMSRMALHHGGRSSVFRGLRYPDLLNHLFVYTGRTNFPLSMRSVNRPHFPLTTDIAQQRGARQKQQFDRRISVFRKQVSNRINSILSLPTHRYVSVNRHLSARSSNVAKSKKVYVRSELVSIASVPECEQIRP